MISRWLRNLSVTALGYTIAGVAWSLLVSFQRGSAGLDPIDGAFAIRGLLRAIVWPFDLAEELGLPWPAGALALTLLVSAISVIVARVWARSRRPSIV